MRVLFWSLSFWPNIGGLEILAAKLVAALRDRGHEFLIVAPKTSPELPDAAQYHGIPIERCYFQNTTKPAGIDHLLDVQQKVATLKRLFAPDLVHVNGVGPTDFFHLTTRKAHRAPTLVTLHGEWQPQTDGIVARTLRESDWVAGCCAAVLEHGRRLAPQMAPRSSVIYNGLETPALASEPLPFDRPRILCLGRLSPEKGTDVALASFVSILARFPDARLIIAGDGVLRSDLERQAAAHGIARAVDFIGWVGPDEVPALINTSTIVLMPSRRDSLPLVALEAALMARPIVATRVGGLPEVVVHEETGLLCESENSQALAHAVLYLLSHPDTATRMGASARARAQTLFGWEHHVSAYDTLYRELTAVQADLQRTSSRNRD
jgi:glycosyltransferase involved in cell wall biosynthesis